MEKTAEYVQNQLREKPLYRPEGAARKDIDPSAAGSGPVRVPGHCAPRRAACIIGLCLPSAPGFAGAFVCTVPPRCAMMGKTARAEKAGGHAAPPRAVKEEKKNGVPAHEKRQAEPDA